MKAIDITGRKFNRLTVISRADNIPGGQACWNVQCDCGNVFKIRAHSLKSGRTKSCGCFKVETTIRRSTKHGHATKGISRTYHTWAGMIDRCTNPKNSHWKYYGGKGIFVCARWRNFKNFLADMGDKPMGFTLERIKTNRGYNPSNCCWATNKEQANNKTTNRFITFNGKSQTIAQWAEEIGITHTTLAERLMKWPIDKALMSPKKEQRDYGHRIKHTLNGETLTLLEWARKLDIKPTTVYYRYHNNLPINIRLRKGKDTI